MMVITKYMKEQYYKGKTTDEYYNKLKYTGESLEEAKARIEALRAKKKQK